ncbi:hypothetical protein AK812_SmicGene2902 [Symbiodinium microadriaticum]|uniref:Uncharacterized protein n=1 Tax=Symbiodinium microadriaticum TaxID=2951 RepID=A0A1Q9EZY8_SYMMI|nr:hypothetical protein AK812_SmicGene2902 [Symbiodinium microadriaticum]
MRRQVKAATPDLDLRVQTAETWDSWFQVASASTEVCSMVFALGTPPAGTEVWQPERGGGSGAKWHHWRGVDSPRAPWRRDPKTPSFPSFTQMGSRDMRAWESQALEGTVSEPSALQSQQKLLTIEKKSESRAQKLEAEALEALEARDGRYQEKLLASYLRPGIPSPDQKERGEKRMDVEGAVSAPSFVGVLKPRPPTLVTAPADTV